MKIDEIIFFAYCYVFRTNYNVSIRDIIHLFSEQMPEKRCWYLLKKWSRKGFYDYGVALDLGWFESRYMPEQYKNILKTL